MKQGAIARNVVDLRARHAQAGARECAQLCEDLRAALDAGTLSAADVDALRTLVRELRARRAGDGN